MGVLLECSGLTKRFGKREALKQVDLSVESGKIIGLLGPNGSGKTTLIKLANGLLRPDGGSIRIDGQEPGAYTKSIVSYLPDRMYFADWMRVSDMVRMFRDFYTDFRLETAEDMLERLEISGSERMKSLSKGTKEKVQLALVMSRKAKLYLLDEPIGGVDPAARDYILQTVIRAYRPQSSIILSTHLVRDVEAFLDDFILLRYGQMLLHAPVAYVTQEKGTTLDAFFREEFRC